MIVTCKDCGVVGEQAKGQGNLCPACSLAYQRDYRKKNKKRLKQYYADKFLRMRKDPKWVASERKRGREYWYRLRHEVIMAYGGYRCACCGEAEPKFLGIDHSNNDGAKHRRSMGFLNRNGRDGSGGPTWKWLKDNKYPSGFQVLCMNCNFGKARNGGICPHRTSQENRVKTGEAQTG